MKWISKNWYNALIFLFLYTLLFICLFILPKGLPLFLIWIQIPIYFLHEFEEYVFPSGWMNIMKETIAKGDERIMPYLEVGSVWVNIPFVWIGFLVSALLATYVDISFGLYSVFFSLFAVIPHFGLFIKRRYNPGFIASLCLNFPVSFYTLHYLGSNHLVSGTALLIGCIAGFLGLFIPTSYTSFATKKKLKNLISS